MGKKITQYPNNVSTNPDNLSLLDLSEKTGASTFESRKWNLTAFKAWVNSWVVAGAVAWNDITGKPTGTVNKVAKFTTTTDIGDSQITDDGTNVSIGTTLDPDRKVNILTNQPCGIYLENTGTFGGTGIRVEHTTPTLAGSHFGFYTTLNDALNSYGLTAIVTATNDAIGVSATASGGILNKGLSGSANSNLNTSNTNYGVEGYAVGGDKSYGGRFEARNGSTHSVGIWAQVPPTSVIGNKYSVQLEDGTEAVGKFLKSVTTDGKANWSYLPTEIQLAVSDETTALTTGTGKITFRMPYAMTVTEVRASLSVAGTTSGLTTIDINEGGASILSTKLTIDLTEKTSTTATTPAVISDTALADDAEITVDIDAISGGATEKGLKILLKGYRIS